MFIIASQLASIPPPYPPELFVIDVFRKEDVASKLKTPTATVKIETDNKNKVKK